MERVAGFFGDYRKSYNVFKRLPLIIFFAILAISPIVIIVDAKLKELENESE